jgi:hypothetical protein
MQNIKKQLAVLSTIFKRELTQDIVNFYMDSLQGIPEELVSEALKKCSVELSRFPTLADIHARIKTSQIDEFDVVGLIYEAIELYGYPRPDRAREHMGEVAWRAVLSCGGWRNICNTPASDDTSLRAQLRMAAQGAIRRYKEEPEAFTAQLPNQSSNKLTSLADSFKEISKDLIITNEDYQKDIPF